MVGGFYFWIKEGKRNDVKQRRWEKLEEMEGSLSTARRVGEQPVNNDLNVSV